MVDRSTSLDQFQTDADEADALDYVDANFSIGSTDTTSAQVIVRDDNVLDKETLVSILEYERALRTNETVNGTPSRTTPREASRTRRDHLDSGRPGRRTPDPRT